MLDISFKPVELRVAQAIAIVLCSPDTIQRLNADPILKQRHFDSARTAAFAGVKNTPQLFQEQHPASVDYINVSFSLLHQNNEFVQPELLANTDLANKTGILILTEVKSIGRVNMEMQALTGSSVAALSLYEGLNSANINLKKDNEAAPELSITGIQLLGKQATAGKYFHTAPTCAILVCSDSILKGTRLDKSGSILQERLTATGAQVIDYQLCGDDRLQIQAKIKSWVEKDIHFIFTTGGTGLGPKDQTVTAVQEILERDADGITDAMRSHGQMRTPLAMMSRAAVGSIAQTLIVTLPGSTDGVNQCLDALLPAVFKARKMMKSGGN